MKHVALTLLLVASPVIADESADFCKAARADLTNGALDKVSRDTFTGITCLVVEAADKSSDRECTSARDAFGTRYKERFAGDGGVDCSAPMYFPGAK